MYVVRIMIYERSHDMLITLIIIMALSRDKSYINRDVAKDDSRTDASRGWLRRRSEGSSGQLQPSYRYQHLDSEPAEKDQRRTGTCGDGRGNFVESRQRTAKYVQNVKCKLTTSWLHV